MHDLRRVVFLTRMRLSDMPIRDLQRYVALATRPLDRAQRLALLRPPRVGGGPARRPEEALRIIDFKIDVYGGHCGP